MGLATTRSNRSAITSSAASFVLTVNKIGNGNSHAAVGALFVESNIVVNLGLLGERKGHPAAQLVQYAEWGLWADEANCGDSEESSKCPYLSKSLEYIYLLR